MNLEHDFFQVSKLSEDQKKRSSQKMENFFPEFKWKSALRVKLLEGLQMKTIFKLLGGIQSNYWGNISPIPPPPPPGFGTPVWLTANLFLHLTNFVYFYFIPKVHLSLKKNLAFMLRGQSLTNTISASTTFSAIF